jgi:hypothetical protein|tara:strand:+ start:577 stop:735 length:159 start_codon:yes stop_codon:yes gene_type:complete
MTKKTFKSKKNAQWEYDETPEVRAAIARLHEDIRKRSLKDEDDKLGYDTGSK